MSEAREHGETHQSHRLVRMKIWHPGCWTLETTGVLPGTRIIENALYPAPDRITADLFLATDGTVSLDEFVDAIDAHSVVESVTVLGESERRGRVLVVYDADSSIVPQVADADFVPIEPVYVTEGYEHWTVMAREERFGERIHVLQRDFKVEIEGIDGFASDTDVASVDSVDQIGLALSARQTECLLAAYDAGYYRWPREVTATEVASKLGISNPTFLEHLRLAEEKLMNVILDELATTHSS